MCGCKMRYLYTKCSNLAILNPNTCPTNRLTALQISLKSCCMVCLLPKKVPLKQATFISYCGRLLRMTNALMPSTESLSHINNREWSITAFFAWTPIFGAGQSISKLGCVEASQLLPKTHLWSNIVWYWFNLKCLLMPVMTMPNWKTVNSELYLCMDFVLAERIHNCVLKPLYKCSWSALESFQIH